MDPELIKQFREQLRAQGVTMSAVTAYAKSQGIDTARRTVKPSPAAPSAQVAPAPGDSSASSAPTTTASAAVENKKQKLIALMKGPLPKILQQFRPQVIARLEGITDQRSLNIVSRAIVDMIEVAKKIQVAGPEAQQAFAGIVSTSAAAAEKQAAAAPAPAAEPKTAEQPSPAKMSEGQFVQAMNEILQTNNRPAVRQAYRTVPNIVGYDVKGKVISGADPFIDTAWLTGITSVQPDLELLALGWAVRPFTSYLTADNGRVAEEFFGEMFDISSGDNWETVKPAIRDKTSGSIVQKGSIKAPFSQ